MLTHGSDLLLDVGLPGTFLDQHLLTYHAQAYCVKGSPACTAIYTVVSGDYCAEIEYNYNLTLTQLYDLNPWLDSACGEQYMPL